MSIESSTTFLCEFFHVDHGIFMLLWIQTFLIRLPLVMKCKEKKVSFSLLFFVQFSPEFLHYDIICFPNVLTKKQTLNFKQKTFLMSLLSKKHSSAFVEILGFCNLVSVELILPTLILSFIHVVLFFVLRETFALYRLSLAIVSWKD